MVVMTAVLDFRLRYAHSLKDKRQVSRSVLRRLPREMPVQVAEVDSQDDPGRLVLGVVAIGTERAALEHRLRRAVSWLERELMSDAASVTVEER